MNSSEKKSYEIFLNVYDLHTMNDSLYPLGLGIYHSSIEVNGREWSYGGNPDYAGTGVFFSPPRMLEFFRETIYLGTASLTRKEFDQIITSLSKKFIANQYDMLTRNCNTFSDAFSRALLGRGTPGWVNRLASFGKLCKCCLGRSAIAPPTCDDPPKDKLISTDPRRPSINDTEIKEPLLKI